jgi:hypothetical protein
MERGDFFVCRMVMERPFPEHASIMDGIIFKLFKACFRPG